MLVYRDSSFDRPNAAQAAAAFAAGVRVWGGYLAAVVPPGPRSSGGSNLATSWTQTDFQVLQQAGIACVAFCSGWDDAAACGALARTWGVRPMLDCEDAIRGDGPWVDAWLQASGAGLYGLCSVHGHVAPAHIVARYPGVTVAAASWDPQCPAPAGLLGWQAEGTHQDPATGLSVDGGWVDDGFAMEATMDPKDGIVQELRYGIVRIIWLLSEGQPLGASFDATGTPTYTPEPSWPNWLASQFAAGQQTTAAALADLKTALGQLQVPPADLQPVLDAVNRIEAGLRGA